MDRNLIALEIWIMSNHAGIIARAGASSVDVWQVDADLNETYMGKVRTREGFASLLVQANATGWESVEV